MSQLHRASWIRAIALCPFVLAAAACGGHGTPTDGSAADQEGGTTGDGSVVDMGFLPDGAPIESGVPNDGPPPSDGGVVYSDAGMTVHDMTGTFTCYQVTCRGHLLQCGDCMDNDNDGYIDQNDPDCLGPCDNTEDPILDPGVGGVTSASCNSRNCYFDYGAGMGISGCSWALSCDPLAPDPNCPYMANQVGGHFCPQPEPTSCLQECEPLTPNGCDCFGCCAFRALATAGPGGTQEYVYLGSTDSSGAFSCSFDTINDPTKCHPCTPEQSCFNGCGACEVCIGDPPGYMPPPSCYTTPPQDAGTLPDGAVNPDAAPPSDAGVNTMQCPTGEQPCGLPGQAACPTNYYCITGCCILAPA